MIFTTPRDTLHSTVIGMDRNCHRKLFGLETNERGDHREEFIGQYNLKAEKQGGKNTFQTAFFSSIIDETAQDVKMEVSVLLGSLELNQSSDR